MISMCCMELGSMGCSEIALAKNYTMLHQAIDFAPWSCDSAYEMLFSSAMVRMEKLSSNCLQHRSSSCDSAYEMLFSVAPEIPWMEVQSFIMEHHGSSSKAMSKSSNKKKHMQCGAECSVPKNRFA